MSDLENAKEALRSWAKQRPFVRRLWIFGSRSRDAQPEGSDLDVAIDFDAADTDEDCGTTWACEGDKWQAELQSVLPWRLDLEWYDPAGSTPTIAAGIADGGVLIYQRET